MKSAFFIMALSGVVSFAAQAKQATHQCSPLMVNAGQEFMALADTSVSIYQDNTAIIAFGEDKQSLHADLIQESSISSIANLMARYGEKVSVKNIASAQGWQLCDGLQCVKGEKQRYYLELTLKSGQKKSLIYFDGEAFKCGSTKIPSEK